MKLNEYYYFDDGAFRAERFKGFVLMNEEGVGLLEAKVKQIRNELNILNDAPNHPNPLKLFPEVKRHPAMKSEA